MDQEQTSLLNKPTFFLNNLGFPRPIKALGPAGPKPPKNTEPFPAGWLAKYDYEQLERLAILTISGKLSDDEAERELRGLKA